MNCAPCDVADNGVNIQNDNVWFREAVPFPILLQPKLSTNLRLKAATSEMVTI